MAHLRRIMHEKIPPTRWLTRADAIASLLQHELEL